MGRGRNKGRPLHGWLAIHKEAGITSTGVVEAVRRITRAAKAGHGGTLDPFSEGLLPIAMGEATKTLAMVLDGDKQYRCWIRFGSETDTGDPTGQVTERTDRAPEPEALAAALAGFVGEREQIPPAYSAIHINGVRAYELARQGETVVIPPRMVTFHELTLENFSDGLAQVVVRCGKGTYMRALARDLGRQLGCLAHLERLLRMETLGFTLEHGITLDQLRAAVDEHRLNDVLLPVDRVLDDIPALRLRPEAWHKIQNGQAVWLEAESCEAGLVRLYTPDNRFGAIGELSAASTANNRRLCSAKKLFHIP